MPVPISQEITMTRHETARQNRIKLHNKIRSRIKHLYDVERLRPDDVYKKVADEFCISIGTATRIFKAK